MYTCKEIFPYQVLATCGAGANLFDCAKDALSLSCELGCHIKFIHNNMAYVADAKKNVEDIVKQHNDE